MKTVMHKMVKSGSVYLYLLLFSILLAPDRAHACMPTPTPTPICSAPAGPADAWTRPEAPTALSAAPWAGDPMGTMNLTWTDNSSKETGYVVERATSDSGPWGQIGVSDPNVTTYQDKGLLAGSSFYYRVHATITGGADSLPSNVASGVTVSRVVADLIEALNSNLVSWSASGNAVWFKQMAATNDGVSAAQSGAIGDNQSSTIQVDVSGPGEISFWWRVSSEANFDFLSFYIDGQLQERISGETLWQQKAYGLAAGKHTLKWVYAKDAQYTVGADCGYLDQAIWSTTQPQPTPTPVYAGSVVDITTANNATRASFDNLGNLALKGRLLPQQSFSENETAKAWFVRDNGSPGLIKALVSLDDASAGDLKIAGVLHEKTPPPSDGLLFTVTNNISSPVAGITQNGDLYLKGFLNPASPATPSGLDAVLDTSGSAWKIDLSWPDSPTSSRDGFRIDRSIGSGPWIENYHRTAAAATSWSDTVGITELTTFHYRIYAILGDNYSNYVEKSVSTPPMAPDNLVAAPISSQHVHLTWNNHSQVAEGNLIVRWPDGGYDTDRQSFTVAASGTPPELSKTYEDTDPRLQEGTFYHYNVMAYKGGSLSSPAWASYVLTPPNDPGAFNAVPDPSNPSSKIILTWIDQSGVEDAFLIERAEDLPDGSLSNWVAIPQVDTNGVAGNNVMSDTDDQGITAGTTYHYRISVYVTAQTTTVQSEPVEAPPVTTAPAAPTSFTALPDSGNPAGWVKLNWHPEFTTATEIKIERSLTGQDGDHWDLVDPAAFSGESCIDKGPNNEGLTEGTLYYYRLAALQGTQQSTYVRTSVTTLVPAAPTGFTAVPNPDNPAGAVNLTWTNHSSVATKIIIECLDQGSWRQVGTLGPNDSSCLDRGLNDGGLTEGTTYQYRVSAFKDTQQSIYALASVTTVSPAAPADFTATIDPGASVPTVNLVWRNVSHVATGIKIERSLTGGATGPWTPVGPSAPDATSFNDSGLNEDTVYHYRISALQDEQRSVYAQTSVSTSLMAPDYLVAAPISSQHVHLTWNNHSQVAEGNLIVRWPDGGYDTDRQSFTVAASGTPPELSRTYEDMDEDMDPRLQEGIFYHYNVMAYKGDSLSSPAWASYVLTPPKNPGAFNAVPDPSNPSSKISLTWIDQSGVEDAFLIERAEDLPDGSLSNWVTIAQVDTNGVAGNNVMSYIDDNAISAATTYRYRISALGVIQSTPVQSEPVEAPPVTTAPAAPTDFTALPDSGNPAGWVKLNWHPEFTTATEIKIERSLTGQDGDHWDQVDPAGFNGTSCIDKGPNNGGLTEGTLYYYRLAALKGTQQSTYVGTSVTTAVPAAPTGLNAVKNPDYPAGSVNLTWTNHSTVATKIVIERLLDQGTWQPVGTLEPNKTSCTDWGPNNGGLTEGTTYQYRISAFKDTQQSADAPLASVTTDSPVVPADFTASIVPGTTPPTVKLEWRNVSSVATGIKIERSLTGGVTGPWTPVGPSTLDVTFFNDMGLSDGTVYYYRISALQGVQQSVYAQTHVCTPPAAPTNFRTPTRGSNDPIDEVKLEWDYGNSAGVDGFTIERSLDGTNEWNPVWAMKSNENSCTDNKNIIEDTICHYRICAFKGEQKSAYAYIDIPIGGALVLADFTAVPNPDDPTRQIKLTWRNVSDLVTQIKIERSSIDVQHGWSTQFSTTLVVNPALKLNPTSYIDTGTNLTAGTIYYYRIYTLYTSQGVNKQSGYHYASAQTLANAPTDLRATPEYNEQAKTWSINLTWVDNIKSHGFGYKIDRIAGTDWPVNYTTSDNTMLYNKTLKLITSWFDTNNDLLEGRTFSYRISAYQGWQQVIGPFGDDHSYPTTPTVDYAAAQVIVPVIPPSNLTAVATSSHHVLLNWHNNSAVATGIEIVRWTGVGNESERKTFSITNASAETYADQDPDLKEGTVYNYSVKARKDDLYSDPILKSVVTPPNDPEAFTAGPDPAESAQQVILSWHDLSNVENGYSIDRSLDNGMNWSNIYKSKPNEVTFTDTGLKEVTACLYRIHAFMGAQQSGLLPASVTTAPATPTDLRAVAGSSTPSVTLRWNDHSAVESGFQIERFTSGGVPGDPPVSYQTAPNVTTWPDVNVNVGATYRYQVRALGANNVNSSAAGPVEVTVPAPPPAPAIPAPTGLHVQSQVDTIVQNGVNVQKGSTTQFVLSWTHYDGPAGTKIKIECMGDGDEDFSVVEAAYEQQASGNQQAGGNPQIETYLATVPQPGHYIFRICAFTPTDTSNYSEEKDCWTYPPDPVHLDAINLTSQKIMFYWDSCNVNQCVFSQSIEGSHKTLPAPVSSYIVESPDASAVYSIHFENPPDETGPKISATITKTITLTAPSTLNLNCYKLKINTNDPDNDPIAGAGVQIKIGDGGSWITKANLLSNDPYDQENRITIQVMNPTTGADAGYSLVKWVVDDKERITEGNALQLDMTTNHTVKAIFAQLVVKAVNPVDESDGTPSLIQYTKLDTIFSGAVYDPTNGTANLSNSIRVCSSQTGRMDGSYFKYGNDNEFTYRFALPTPTPVPLLSSSLPNTPAPAPAPVFSSSFHAGEEITVSVLKSADGPQSGQSSISRPFVWRGYAKAGNAGEDTIYGLSLPFGDPGLPVTSLAVGDLNGIGDLAVVSGYNGSPATIQFFDSSKFSLTESGLYSPLEGFCQLKDLLSGQGPAINKTTAVAIGDLGGHNVLYNDLTNNNTPVYSTGANLPDIVVVNDGGPIYAYIARLENRWKNDQDHSVVPNLFYTRLTIGASDLKARAVALGDLDGDGKTDIVVGCDGQPNKILYNNKDNVRSATDDNDGNGKPYLCKSITNDNSTTDFESHEFGDGSHSTRAIKLGDFDGDGDLDIAVAYYGAPAEIFYNDNGVFTRSVKFGAGSSLTTSMAVGDFNGDGYPDIALGNMDQTNEVYINNKDLTFTRSTLNDDQGNPLQASTTSIITGDFNGDGYLDLAVGTAGQESNPIYLNQGATNPGVFTRGSWVGVNGSVCDDTWALAAGDFDGDGDLDIVTGNRTQASAIYLREPSAFVSTSSMASNSSIYDWAYGIDTTKLLSPPLLPQPKEKPGDFCTKYTTKNPVPSITSSDNDFIDETASSPRVATDDRGHWVAVYSTNYALDYQTYGNRAGTDRDKYTDPILRDFTTLEKVVADGEAPTDSTHPNAQVPGSNIVISRFWDMRKTGGGPGENGGDPKGHDVWRNMHIDDDTLWSPPVPVNQNQASKNYDSATTKKLDYTWPDIATDKHGTWGVAWTDTNKIDHSFSENYSYTEWLGEGLSGYIPYLLDSAKSEDGHSWLPYVQGHLYLSMSFDNAMTWSTSTPTGDLLEGWEPHRNILKPTIVSDGKASPDGEWKIMFAAQTMLLNRRLDDTWAIYCITVSTTSNGTFSASVPEKICDNCPLFDVYWPTHLWGIESVNDGDPKTDASPYYPSKEYLQNVVGFDLGTDGQGNWLAAWQTGVGHDGGGSLDRDLKFAIKTPAMTKWSLSQILNTTAVSDVEDVVDNGWYYEDNDIQPVISYWNDKWWVFWATDNADRPDEPGQHQFGYKWLQKQRDSSTNTKGRDFDIVYACTTPTKLQADYNPVTNGWGQTLPWDKPEVLNADALEDNSISIAGGVQPTYKKDYAPAVAKSDDTMLVSWKSYHRLYAIQDFDEERKIGYAIFKKAKDSTDHSETVDNSPTNSILGGLLPFERKTPPAVAADSTGNFMAVYKLNNDIVSACSPGLVTADRARSLVPLPDATPTPVPMSVPSQPLITGAVPMALYTTGYGPNGSTGGYEYLQNIYTFRKNAQNQDQDIKTLEGNGVFHQAVQAELEKLGSSTPWAVSGSANDAVQGPKGTLVIFNVPLLGRNGIETVRQIRSLDLSFKAARMVNNVAKPADFQLWVFMNGYPKEWCEPLSWKLMGSWNNMADINHEFTCQMPGNRSDYIETYNAAVGEYMFGGKDTNNNGLDDTGGYTRPNGTVTFAIFSKQSTAPDSAGAELNISDVKVNVYPRYSLASTVKFAVPSLRQCVYQPNGLTFYSEIADSGGGKIGAGRVILKPAADQTAADTLDANIVLLRPPAHPRVFLKWDGGEQDLSDFGTIGAPDPATGKVTMTLNKPLSEIFGTESGADARRLAFLSALVAGTGDGGQDGAAGRAYLELRDGIGSTTDLAGGQLIPDSDDDGLTDLEEVKDYQTDKLDRDSDDDGLFDGEEILKLGDLMAKTKDGSNPNQVDSDGDGLADGLEVGLTVDYLATYDAAHPEHLGRVVDGALPKTITLSGAATQPGPFSIKWTAPAPNNIHAVAGLRLDDADKGATWTDPKNPDTDGDGYWDGPSVWVEGASVGFAGLILRNGEDKNGDGKVDAAGADGVPGNRDDETKPDDGSSQPSSYPKVWAHDENRNRIPDDFEAFATDEVGEAAAYWFGDNPAEVAASVVTDASDAYGGSSGSGGSSGTFSVAASVAVSDPKGEGAQIMKDFRAAETAFKGSVATYSPYVMLGNAYTKFLFDINYLTLSDNSNGGGTTDWLNLKPNPVDPITKQYSGIYHGTFVNGIRQSTDSIRKVTGYLSEAYGIPVMYSANPTNGGAYDFGQCVIGTFYNVIPFLNLLHYREKSSQSLVKEWERIWNLGDKDQEIVHFAYSQGAIISDAALYQFWLHHLYQSRKRLHVVIFGSGYAFLNPFVLPTDTHFVYDKGDIVNKVVGGANWNPLNYFHLEKHSKIVNYPGPWFDGVGPHSHTELDGVPDTYSWWYYYVGGPIFQRSDSDHDIHGERWWLHHHGDNWWDNDVEVEDGGLEMPGGDAWVKASYRNLLLFRDHSVTFKPKF